MWATLHNKYAKRFQCLLAQAKESREKGIKLKGLQTEAGRTHFSLHAISGNRLVLRSGWTRLVINPHVSSHLQMARKRAPAVEIQLSAHVIGEMGLAPVLNTVQEWLPEWMTVHHIAPKRLDVAVDQVSAEPGWDWFVEGKRVVTKSRSMQPVTQVSFDSSPSAGPPKNPAKLIENNADILDDEVISVDDDYVDSSSHFITKPTDFSHWADTASRPSGVGVNGAPDQWRYGVQAPSGQPIRFQIDGMRMTGVGIGRRTADASCYIRVYDKTLQTSAVPTARWWLNKAMHQGFRPNMVDKKKGQAVWRTEAEFRSARLQQLGIRSLSDIVDQEKMYEAWAWATAKPWTTRSIGWRRERVGATEGFFRVVRTGKGNARKRDPTPYWETLWKVGPDDWDKGVPTPVARSYDTEMIRKGAMGYLFTWAAAEGWKSKARLKFELNKILDELDDHDVKSEILGRWRSHKVDDPGSKFAEVLKRERSKVAPGEVLDTATNIRGIEFKIPTVA